MLEYHEELSGFIVRYYRGLVANTYITFLDRLELMCYILGHGSPSGWNGERIWTTIAIFCIKWKCEITPVLPLFVNIQQSEVKRECDPTSASMCLCVHLGKDPLIPILRQMIPVTTIESYSTAPGGTVSFGLDLVSRSHNGALGVMQVLGFHTYGCILE